MDYITTTEAAEIAQIHPGHLRRLLARGQVPGAQKVGRVWIVPREWAETFQRQRKKRLDTRG